MTATQARPFATIPQLLDLTLRENPRPDAYYSKKKGGQWAAISHQELGERVEAIALGLYALGIQPGDLVGLLSENRLEWILADLAILCAGAADVPIYPNQTRAHTKYILNDCQPQVLFISSQQVNKILSIRDDVSVKQIVVFEGRYPVPEEEGFRSLAQLEELGRKWKDTNRVDLQSIKDKIRPSDLATLIYTSGTTGEPKGVMLTHLNLASNCHDVGYSKKWFTRDDTALSFLPWCHVYERIVTYCYLYTGCAVYIAESIEKVSQNIQEVRPTVMSSVPRVFEKIYQKILDVGRSAGFPKKNLLNWSLGVADRWARLHNAGKPIPATLAAEHALALKLVFSKWRKALGGRIRYFLSGGAPLSPELAYIFYGAGIPVLEGYGLTETSPVVSANYPNQHRIGTTGKPIANVEVRIAPDGEILVRGPNVMQGYYKKPKDTADSFEGDWLKTGDIGVLDADGYLAITDRKKDLFKTSGGKYIAPQPIENRLKLSPFISQVVVVGNARKFAGALVVPQMEALEQWAKSQRISYNSADELVKNPKVVDMIFAEVQKVNENLAQYEKIKRIALLPREFTIDEGELTPTQKVRRGVVEKKYRHLIDGLYTAADSES